ncbi:MAG: efflux transporter periplasmic adaptor subunit [Nevskia sp.]|nr:efflux transporter periplasmic adaptor subunit [Nevskia sp.]
MENTGELTGELGLAPPVSNRMNSVNLEHSPARPWRFTRPAIVVVTITLIASVWLLSRHGAGPAAAPKSDAVAPVELAAADVAEVQLKALNRELPVSGSLSPLWQTTLKSKVAGEVLDMSVREGQAVHRGDVLAHIDVRNASAQRDSQAATLEKARADLALAKLNRDNSKALLAEHFISQNAYDSASSTYEASAASERLAAAQLRLAQIALEDAVVRAPFDGVIAQRLAQPGEKVSQDSPILALVDLTKMELQASAPASEVPGIKVGQIARFRVDGFGDRLFEGRVERINPITDAGSRSITVYLAVENPDSALKGGMFAQGNLILDHGDPLPAVPTAALHNEAGLPYVFVLDKELVAKRMVTPGLGSNTEGWTEIRDGVVAGERIITARMETLKAGDRVVLKDDAASATAGVSPSGH